MAHWCWPSTRGGKITVGVQPYRRLAGARDLYDRSPTLQNIPPSALHDDFSIIKFLLTYRDCVAVENLKAMGKLKEDAYIFEGAEGHYALVTLVAALFSAGMITLPQFQRIGSTIAAPLDYFLERRLEIEPEVMRTLDDTNFMSGIDRSIFTHLNDSSRRLSNKYVRDIIRAARWLIREEVWSTRSLYTAPEMAFMALFSYPDVLAQVSQNLATRMEEAMGVPDSLATRREVVGMVVEVINYYSTMGQQTTDAKTQEALRWMRYLVELNRDLLAGSADEGSGGGGGGNIVGYADVETIGAMSAEMLVPGGTTAQSAAQNTLMGGALFSGAAIAPPPVAVLPLVVP